MIISNVTQGTCNACEDPAVREIDGKLYCGHCADNKLLKQMKRCIEAMTEVIVTIKVLPKQSFNKGKDHGKEEGI
jgi:uncharacterized Zn finger protein (UPF0148 family)